MYNPRNLRFARRSRRTGVSIIPRLQLDVRHNLIPWLPKWSNAHDLDCRSHHVRDHWCSDIYSSNNGEAPHRPVSLINFMTLADCATRDKICGRLPWNGWYCRRDDSFQWLPILTRQRACIQYPRSLSTNPFAYITPLISHYNVP